MSSHKSSPHHAKKRISELKQKEFETEEDYVNRIGPHLTDIKKIMLSKTEKIESIEDIIANWYEAIENNIEPWYKDTMKNKEFLGMTILQLFLLTYLQNKYKNERNVYINPKIIYFDKGVKSIDYEDDDVSDEKMDDINEFYKLAKNDNINIIVNIIGIEAHACAVIVNKYLGTIEYYDPEGYTIYEDSTYQKIFKQIKSFFVFALSDFNYKFLGLKETNLYYGIQRLGDKMEKFVYDPHDDGSKTLLFTGFCVTFTVMIINYRIHYPQITPLTCQKLLLIQLTEDDYKFKKDLKRGFTKKELDNISFSDFTNLEKNVFTFLLNYLKFVTTKINQPEMRDKIKKYMSNNKHIKSYPIKVIRHHSIPYSNMIQSKKYNKDDVNHYNDFIREVLDYFYHKKLMKFLSFMQIEDNMSSYQLKTFKNTLEIYADFIKNNKDFLISVRSMTKEEYTILKRLYVLFIMFFRFKKLEQQFLADPNPKKYKMPSVKEFRQEWENILKDSSKKIGQELYVLIDKFINNVVITKTLMSDYKNYKKLYFKVLADELYTPMSENNYEIRQFDKDKKTSKYRTFNLIRAPWFYELDINDLIKPVTQSNKKSKIKVNNYY